MRVGLRQSYWDGSREQGVARDGPALVATARRCACKLKLEGIVSKRADAPYRSGARPEWVKTKCDVWREANRERFKLFEKGGATKR